MADKTLVKVLIPIYKNEIDIYEQKSLNQCCKILAKYPIVFVKPQSLDISNLKKDYPRIEMENFADDYFESIVSYNRLMLSTEFYDRFSDCQYILIYQLDAYVFRDELEEWCKKNYDYIGAPWLLKPKYHRFHLYLFLKIKAFYYFLINRPLRKVIVGDKVGNGGFSLRKVASHIRVTVEKKRKIKHYLSKSKIHSEFNEDIFWGTQNPQFVYPKLKEALSFAIDDYPELCFRLNQNKLPFGCHAWSKPLKNDFWKDKIIV
jgi:hypothetical protein